MNLRKIIKGLIPYGIVRLHQKRKEKNSQVVSFWEGYLNYKKNHSHCELLNVSPVKTVVSVQGFGHSGSGAIVDLLREYDNTVVIGNVDNEGSVAARNLKMYEVDFLRMAGGLFEIEKYVTSNNNFHHDAVLHRFIFMVQNSELFQQVEKVRDYFYEFFDKICQVYDPVPYHCTNYHLDYHGLNEVLFIKNMSVSEYRDLARKLLNSLFSCYPNNPEAILVLDQFVGDSEFDIQRYLDYIPNLKPILVYRDPRDVYVFAKTNHIFWMPTSTPELFIDRYKRRVRNLDVNKSPGYFITNFENVVRHYDQIVAEIEDFLQIDKSMHIHPKSAFDPEVSNKNIGVYKQYPEFEGDCQTIANELNPYIFKE